MGLTRRMIQIQSLWPRSPLRIGRQAAAKGCFVFFHAFLRATSVQTVTGTHTASNQQCHGSCICCAALMSLMSLSFFFLAHSWHSTYFYSCQNGREKRETGSTANGNGNTTKGSPRGPFLRLAATLEQSACEMEHVDQHPQFRQFSCE